MTLERKLKEARYALAIEQELSKDEILERYLNIAYFGNGVYGIGTAASFYFGKPVQELTLEEGALLAGIVQSPGRFDPVKAMADPALMERLLARRDLVLGRMQTESFISADQLRRVPSGRRRPSASSRCSPAARTPRSRRRSSATTCATSWSAAPWARRSAPPARSARTGCSPAA